MLHLYLHSGPCIYTQFMQVFSLISGRPKYSSAAQGLIPLKKNVRGLKMQNSRAESLLLVTFNRMHHTVKAIDSNICLLDKSNVLKCTILSVTKTNIELIMDV